MIALEHERWITIEMHRGAFVNAVDEAAVRDHYEMFGLIYGFAVRRAMAVADGVTTLADALDAVVADLNDVDDPVRAVRVALMFNRLVVDAAQSPRTRSLIGAMSTLIPGNFFAEVPGSIPVERDGYAAIVRAIRASDEALAASAYEEMMRRQGALVIDLLAGRGSLATTALG